MSSREGTMRLAYAALCWLGLGTLMGCAVQTEFRTGAQAGPAQPGAPPPATPQARSARRSALPVGPTGAGGSGSRTLRTELHPVSERELTSYRSLISGDEDRVVLDPKLVNATNNVYTKSFNATVGSLEAHAAKYDIPAVMTSHPPCEAAIEQILGEQANDPIRRDEDDVQFGRRRDSGAKGLEHFRKALNSPSDASRPDLRFAYTLFVSKFDDRGNPIGGIPRPRTALAQRIDAVGDKGLCHAKFLLVVNEWWKRQRTELDAKRQADEAAKEAEARKAVLARRFAPVTAECADGWRATSPKCGELQGLSDDERQQCSAACQSSAQEGFKKAFANALATCVDEFERGSLRSCELKKPAGATITDEELSKGIAECKSSCRSQGLQARAQRRPAQGGAAGSAGSGSSDRQGMKQCLDACQRTVPSGDDAALVQSCIDECGTDSACVGMCRAKKGGTRSDRCAADCAAKYP